MGLIEAAKVELKRMYEDMRICVNDFNLYRLYRSFLENPDLYLSSLTED